MNPNKLKTLSACQVIKSCASSFTHDVVDPLAQALDELPIDVKQSLFEKLAAKMMLASPDLIDCQNTKMCEDELHTALCETFPTLYLEIRPTAFLEHDVNMIRQFAKAFDFFSICSSNTLDDESIDSSQNYILLERQKDGIQNASPKIIIQRTQLSDNIGFFIQCLRKFNIDIRKNIFYYYERTLYDMNGLTEHPYTRYLTAGKIWPDAYRDLMANYLKKITGVMASAKN